MVGYAVGGGVEYALGYGWSIKSEYIYINFKSKDFFGQGTSGDLLLRDTDLREPHQGELV